MDRLLKKTNTDIRSLYYKIDDIHVLPSYKIILEEISNSGTYAKLTGEFVQNNCGFYTINARGDLATITQGTVEFEIPSKYRGKSFYVYINGEKHGRITFPADYSGKATFINF